MLSQHFRRTLATAHATSSLPRHQLARRVALAGPSRLPATSRAFTASSRRQDDAPRSPFQIFVNTLREELQKNRDLQDNVKQLQGDVDRLQDSEAMKRARDAYERARLVTSIKENPRLRAAAEELKKQGGKVGDAVGEALRTMEESEIARTLSRATAATVEWTSKTTEPIRNTAAYKVFADTIVDAFDDSGSAKHAGFEEKEERRRRRQLRLEKAGVSGGIAGKGKERVKVNPEAGEALVVHKLNAREQAWQNIKDTNPVFVKLGELRSAYDESENPVVSSLRTVTSTIGGWFEETENAQVVRQFRAIDPTFAMDSFERELREYIVPEVVDAYLTADGESLKKWCSEATYNVLWATMEQYLKSGLVSDSKVLDIRQVDISSAKLLEVNDQTLPVFVVTFNTQEVLLFRNAKTREVMVGKEDRVEQCMYAAVITRIEEDLDDELTGGWKIVEMARRSARAYL